MNSSFALSRRGGRVAPCGAAHLFAAAVVALLWTAALLTFALAHAAASCGSGGGGGGGGSSLSTTVATAAVALALGAGASGLASDRLGRATTLRLALAVGALACVAAVAARPDDAALLLALAAAAGAAAGGSHVAATLLLELAPRRLRATVLLSFPALFFPVALAQRGIEAAGWARATAATLAVCAAAGAGLLCLPESPSFLRARAAALAAETGAKGTAAAVRSGGGGGRQVAVAVEAAAALASAFSPAPPVRSLVAESAVADTASPDAVAASADAGDLDVDLDVSVGDEDAAAPMRPPPGFALGDAVLTPAAERRLRLRRCCARLRVERGTAATAALWLLLTPTVYLTSMVSYLAGEEAALATSGGGDGGGGAAAAASVAGSDVSRLCAARFEPLFFRDGSAGGAVPPARVLSAAASNQTAAAVCAVAEPALALYSLGLHVVSAELLALLLCALLLGSRALHTRTLLAASLSASALALVLAAAASRALSCDSGDVPGSLARAAVEFVVRLTLSLAAQALFVHTLESCAAGVRGRAAGAAVALFRLGALLTLATSASRGGAEQRQALMWSVFALQQPLGLLFGLAGGSVEHIAAATAVLAVSSQACFLGACLASSCLPLDAKLPGDVEEEEEEEEEEEKDDEDNGPRAACCGCRKFCSGGGAESASAVASATRARHSYAPIGASGLESPTAVGRLGGFGSAAGVAAAAAAVDAEEADEVAGREVARPILEAGGSPDFLVRVLWRRLRQRPAPAPAAAPTAALADDVSAAGGSAVRRAEVAGTEELADAQREAMRLRLARRIAAESSD